MARPIIPWPGGKRRLLKQLLSDIPKHTTYVEVFCGGAALLLAKQRSGVEVINDINGELVRLYRCCQHHLDELVRQFRWALVSREMFRWTQLQHVDTLTDIQRAARFYYLQKLAFGGKATGQNFGADPAGPPRLNLLRMEEDLSQAHLRLASVTIEQLPWETCIDRYDRPEALFFLDPPYWKVTGYGVPFGMPDYGAMADRIRSLKGRAILTINDHPDMRKVFKGLRCQKVPITYTIGGAVKAPRNELIYRTW
jgi:DNA adenine methylase